VNLSFEGDTLTSATPLFLGANPETIPTGPDKGLGQKRGRSSFWPNYLMLSMLAELHFAGVRVISVLGSLGAPVGSINVIVR